MADVLVELPLLDFAELEVLAPDAVTTPRVIGGDHVQWGFGVLEGRVQGGGGPP